MDLMQSETGAARDIDQNSLRALNGVVFEEGAGNSPIGGVNGAVRARGDRRSHNCVALSMHYGFDIGKVAIDDARQIYRLANDLPNLDVIGIDCHIGSQLTTIAPFVDALNRVLALLESLQADGISVRHIDIGGGLGIRYQDETPPLPDEYATELNQVLAGHNYTIIMEPGRAIAGNAGILLTSVEHLKHSGDRHFAIIDAAMNDLMRPALYNAWQEIIPVQPRSDGELHNYDVVGPVCETGDFLGKDRSLNLVEGDLLAVRSAGAYGFTMSSNYNTRGRAAEVMVDGDRSYLIRDRETVTSLFEHEHLLP